MKFIKNIILCIISIFLMFIICVSRWAFVHFGSVNFDEIIFQLRTPVLSTEKNIMNAFYFNALIPGIIIGIIIFILIKILYRYLTIKNKLVIKRYLTIVIIIISILIPILCLNKFDFYDYLKVQVTNSKFIEKNYVNPKDVDIKFPKDKKNLIFIYLESYESSYFSKELGGVKKDNLLEGITEISKENVNFSDDNDFGGAMNAYGTHWTSAAFVSQSCGIPIKLKASYKKMFDKASGIGDILEKEGYNQEWMFGSDADFGYRSYFIKNHGNYEIMDYYKMIDEGLIDEDYKKWWGVEDKTLFKIAKSELKDLSSKDKPFNFTILTSNTHVQDGYVDESCKKKFKDSYSNSIYCNAYELNEFLRWIEKQDFYKDSVIVLSGDHLTMQNYFFKKSDKRRVYNLIINGPNTINNHNREFSTLDMFPTTLGALGVEIEGNRLGLGTNLYSNRKTLIEEFGYKKFNRGISNKSRFYLDNF